MTHAELCSKCQRVIIQGNYFFVYRKLGGFQTKNMERPYYLILYCLLFFAFSFTWQPATVGKTWEEYQINCGRNALVANVSDANQSFEEDFQSVRVDWSGIIHSGWYLESTLLEDVHCLEVMMDYVEPPQSDLNLCSADMNTIIGNLSDWAPGTYFKFQARIQELGNSDSGPYLELNRTQVLSVAPFYRR